MINFYNPFLPRAAHLLQPLYAALKCKKAKDPVDWLPECIQAFSTAKSVLAIATLLTHPFHLEEIALTTDASDVAVSPMEHTPAAPVSSHFGVYDRHSACGW